MTLEETMKLCRKYGVLSIKNVACAGMPCSVDLDFAPMLAAEPETVADSKPASQRESPVKRPSKLGADGLTEEQQNELFGRPMDAKD